MNSASPVAAASAFPNLTARDPSPDELSRETLDWPEVSEIDVIRHYTRLSQKNHAIDIGIYPLGSCTMKYNPKINEGGARLPGFASIHPYQARDGAGRARADVRAAGACWPRSAASMR